MFGRFAADSTSTAASASFSAPRAQRHTRQPSATSARALASPSPRLEPVTTAILSLRPRSMPGLFDSSAGQVVQAPVHLVEHDTELVFRHDVFFERQKIWKDERDDRALDGRTLAECRGRLVGVGPDELRLAPAEDRRDRHLSGEPVEAVHVAVAHELRLDLAKLPLEPLARVGLAAQTSAADRAASEREVQTRLLELGEDGLLDLIERHRAPGGVQRGAIERTRDLADGAAQRVVR